MELSSFSENIVHVPYERNGEVVNLQVNIDAILPEFYDVLQERLAPLQKRIDKLQKEFKKKGVVTGESEKEILLIQREADAERLTCPVTLPDGSKTSLLKSWDVTENGEPVPVTKETLIKLPPRAVQEIWDLCSKAATTVKKREDVETEETTDNTLSGSKGLRVVGQTT